MGNTLIISLSIINDSNMARVSLAAVLMIDMKSREEVR